MQSIGLINPAGRTSETGLVVKLPQRVPADQGDCCTRMEDGRCCTNTQGACQPSRWQQKLDKDGYTPLNLIVLPGRIIGIGSGCERRDTQEISVDNTDIIATGRLVSPE